MKISLLSSAPFPNSTLLFPLSPPLVLPFSSNASFLRRGMAHRAFQLRLDPLTGNSEWVVVEEGEEERMGGGGSNSKTTLVTTSYLDMLNDSYRNSAFHQAIKKTITKPCHVLDIGAGTGLLSMMAARAMSENGGGGGNGMVTACESYLPMGKLMRKVLRANGMEKKIRVLHKRSDEVEVGVDIESRAHVLFHIEQRYTDSCEIEAADGIHLVPFGFERIVGVKPKQHAMQCSALTEDIKVLSEPFKIFEFEFSERPESHGKAELHVKATNDGKLHAVISWWVLQLDSAGSIFYSTAPKWIRSFNGHKAPPHIPGSKDWCDHWKQCVWFVPDMGIPVTKDSHIFCQASHDVVSTSFSLMKNVETMDHSHGGLDVSYSQITLPPERIGIYGDKNWRTALLAAARNVLQVKDSPFCLVADDSIFLTLAMACLSTTSYVVSVFPGLQERASLYLDAVACANGFSKGRIEVLGKRASCLTGDDLHGRKVNLLVGEPFYYGNEGALPWQNLRFWKERTLLDAFLADDVHIMPCKGVLKACAMSLPDLWRSRCCLNSIEGFDHSNVNEMLGGACGDLPPALEGPCLPYFVWQCGVHEELSKVFSIMEFNFSESIHPCFGKTNIPFVKPGVCHGFALWIDWVIDERTDIVIPTGPDCRYWKQGVKLLSKPVAVNTPASHSGSECCSSEVEAFFNPSNGELDIKYKFVRQNV